MALGIPTRIRRRYVDLIVGRSGAEGQRFRGFANGRQGFWIIARIEHSSGARPNKAKITIHNLSGRNANIVEQSNTTCQLLAGEDVPGLLFRGDISRAETRQESPTRQTIIEAAEGQRIYRDGYIERSWPANTTRSQVLSDLLLAMGAARGYVSPQLPEVRYAQGLVWGGRCAELLDLIYDSDAGERWSLQGTVVDVIARGETKPGNAILLAPDSGLIGVPRRTKGGGVKFKSTLNPRLRPNAGVQLDAQIGGGLYRLAKITHEVDSRGLVWHTECEAVRP